MLRVTARAVRAKTGIDTMPTATMTFCVLAPRIATMRKREDDVGEAQHDVDGAHVAAASIQPRRHAARTPSGTPTRKASATPPTPMPERRAGADQDAAEDIAPELVGAEPVRCGGGLQRLARNSAGTHPAAPAPARRWRAADRPRRA